MTYDVMRDTDDVAVSDCRFDIEADAVRDLGGVVVHVTRPGAGLNAAAGASAGASAGSHISESGVTVKDGDMHLINDGSLADLYEKLDDIFWEVTHGKAG